MGLSWSSNDRRQLLPLIGSGSYRAGCVDLMIPDSGDGDPGIFVRLYYPVDADETKIPTMDNYPVWVPRKEYLEGLAAFLKQSPTKIQFFSDWIIGEKRCSALLEPALAGTSTSLHTSASLPAMTGARTTLPTSRSFSGGLSSFPVLVFSHGLGGSRFMYSTFCASMASYGYVVAAIEHRDYSACWSYKLHAEPMTGQHRERGINMRILHHDNNFKVRNQQLGKRVSECVKTLHVLEELNLGTLKTDNLLIGSHFDWSIFKGRLNLSRAAVAGHSFGGATALAATAFSTDFQAAVVLDGWMFPLDSDQYSRAVQPSLFLNAGRWQWKENLDSMRRFCSDEAERIHFTIGDAVHQSFSDICFLLTPFVARRLGISGDHPPHSIMEAVVETTVAFLRRVHENEMATYSLKQLVGEKYASFVEHGLGPRAEESHL